MEYQWLSSWFVRAQGGSSIFFPDFKIRLRFFWIFPCHRSWFCLPNWMFSGLTLQYIAASLFPLVVPYRLITLYRVHRVFSTLAVTKISVIEYYPCHNTSNILHTYNKYNNPKGCLKYFEWKSNSQHFLRGYKMYFVVSSYYNFHQRLLLQKLCVAFPPSFMFLLWCGLVTCDPFRIRIQLCYYCMCLNNTECKKMPKNAF